jgi:hypothetical protein
MYMQTERHTGEQLVSDLIEQDSSLNKTIEQNAYPQNNVEQASSSEGCSCGSQNGKMISPPSYIFAIGKVTYRFPNKSIEVELAHAIGRRPTDETSGITREEVVYKALTDTTNRYLARQICYIFKIGGLETYIVNPSDPLDIERLAQALRPTSSVGDIDLIIGRRGPLASAEICNGLLVPIVAVDQIYSFDRDTLMKAIPKRKGESDDQFKKTSEALFNNIIQITDNAGATDEHRAINYLAVRYDEIYNRTQLMQNENYSFSSIDVKPSTLSGTRKIVDVILSYENRANRAVQKWFARVDVTEEFPFLVSPLQQYIEH